MNTNVDSLNTRNHIPVWIHCNQCKLSTHSNENKLCVSDCGHVHCEQCIYRVNQQNITNSDGNTLICPMCQTIAIFINLDQRLPLELQKALTPVNVHLADALKISEFQLDQYHSLIDHLKSSLSHVNAKFEQLQTKCFNLERYIHNLNGRNLENEVMKNKTLMNQLNSMSKRSTTNDKVINLDDTSSIGSTRFSPSRLSFRPSDGTRVSPHNNPMNTRFNAKVGYGTNMNHQNSLPSNNAFRSPMTPKQPGSSIRGQYDSPLSAVGTFKVQSNQQSAYVQSSKFQNGIRHSSSPTFISSNSKRPQTASNLQFSSSVKPS
ncbi:hypothetical protein BC833DRAFT_608301 [Globomyces pollinis-pini]|nr:hypothetical protein BC833DRAFT_608301 [Globomyces pollinis-pini]